MYNYTSSGQRVNIMSHILDILFILLFFIFVSKSVYTFIIMYIHPVLKGLILFDVV